MLQVSGIKSLWKSPERDERVLSLFKLHMLGRVETTEVSNINLSHTEFSVRLDEMMIIFILEFINSDCTILSGLVSHFQKGEHLGVYF